MPAPPWQVGFEIRTTLFCTVLSPASRKEEHWVINMIKNCLKVYSSNAQYDMGKHFHLYCPLSKWNQTHSIGNYEALKYKWKTIKIDKHNITDIHTPSHGAFPFSALPCNYNPQLIVRQTREYATYKWSKGMHTS